MDETLKAFLDDFLGRNAVAKAKADVTRSAHATVVADQAVEASAIDDETHAVQERESSRQALLQAIQNA